MEQTVVPCIKLRRSSLFRKYFMFLDAQGARSAVVLGKHGVNIRPEDVFPWRDSQYVVVFCSTRKRDEAAFVEAIREMPNHMLLLGYDDYLACWNDVLSHLEHRWAEHSTANAG